MKKIRKNLLWKVYVPLGTAVCAILFSLSSCAPPQGSFTGNPSPTSTTGSTSYSGYVVIANNTAKTVNLYDSNLNFVRTILNLTISTEVPASLAVYDSTSILVAIEGGASGQDRVIKLNLDGTNDYFTIILNALYTGTSVKGVARLSGGDILSSDSATLANQMERFTPSTSPTGLASRVTIGWPQGLQATTMMIHPGTDNRFVQCSAGTQDVIRTYNNAGGAQIASASATSPVPSLGAAHDVNGCVIDSAGRVAALYNGATDSLRLYSDYNLSSIVWTFTDATKFAAPQALAVRPNGNFLVAELATSDYVVEVSSTGTYVNTFSPVGATGVTAIMVMP